MTFGPSHCTFINRHCRSNGEGVCIITKDDVRRPEISCTATTHIPYTGFLSNTAFLVEIELGSERDISDCDLSVKSTHLFYTQVVAIITKCAYILRALLAVINLACIVINSEDSITPSTGKSAVLASIRSIKELNHEAWVGAGHNILTG